MSQELDTYKAFIQASFNDKIGMAKSITPTIMGTAFYALATFLDNLKGGELPNNANSLLEINAKKIDLSILDPTLITYDTKEALNAVYPNYNIINDTGVKIGQEIVCPNISMSYKKLTATTWQVIPITVLS